MLGAHFDHLGVGRPVEGDSIYNGADDDASGVATVLAVAASLAKSPPRRSVIFLLTSGEESGVLGTQWYLDHPTFPLNRTIADLQVEMVGRPDALIGGPGKLWLTGFDRSTMGQTLAKAGLPVEDDPRPDFRFFERSDNIVFALRGIPAHTLSLLRTAPGLSPALRRERTGSTSPIWRRSPTWWPGRSASWRTGPPGRAGCRAAGLDSPAD